MTHRAPHLDHPLVALRKAGLNHWLRMLGILLAMFFSFPILLNMSPSIAGYWMVLPLVVGGLLIANEVRGLMAYESVIDARFQAEIARPFIAENLPGFSVVSETGLASEVLAQNVLLRGRHVNAVNTRSSWKAVVRGTVVRCARFDGLYIQQERRTNQKHTRPQRTPYLLFVADFEKTLGTSSEVVLEMVQGLLPAKRAMPAVLVEGSRLTMLFTYVQDPLKMPQMGEPTSGLWPIELFLRAVALAE